MAEHSRLFPPSGAARWINCSASAEAVTHYPDVPGDAAMEGTAWHWLVEQCLVQGVDADLFLGRTILVRQDNAERRFVVTREMATDAMLDVNFTREVVRTPGASHVESRIDLSHLHPDCFGKCDLWHVGDNGVLTVKDSKYGRVDVPVLHPDGTLTWQLVLYALGILEKLSREMHPLRMPTQVRLVIVQPRSIQPGPRIKHHTVDVVKILALEPVVRAAIHRVVTNPTFVMGEWCKNCAALGQCPPSQEETRALAPVLTSVALTPYDAARILSRKDLLEKIVKEAEKVARETLLRGGDVPGFKLVTGRKHRQWSDEDKVYDAASDIPGAYAVVTPAQMEKLPGGKEIADRYATIPPGDPTLAPASDKRPPYVARTAEQMFGSIGG